MDEQEDGAAVRILPPLIPVLTILLGAGLKWVVPIGLAGTLPTPARYWIGGLIVIVALLCLGLWPVLMFRRGGQSEIPWTPTTHIVERGPYRFTRNPMYLQMILVCIGFAVILSNEWVLILTPVCGWLLQKFAIKPEEAYLEQKFGESYLAYKRRVRRWI